MFGAFTDISQAVNFTFLFILVISVVLLGLITVLMIAFVIKYHRSRHPVPAQVHSHAVLEVVWTVVPTILALGMFYYGWVGFKLMRTPPPNAMEVTATGRMWSWSFDYENGKQSTELVVPAGTPVKVNLVSADVLHSFYVPAFMVKHDAVPGFENFVWFNPVDTGTYDIFCAEYCGQRHSYMLSKVRAIPEEEFQVWIEEGVEELVIAENASEEEALAMMQAAGERLTQIKGCNACHSFDGSALVGPTYKGLLGRTSTVVTDGQTRQITVDEEYIRRSILEPTADVVEGFQPVMPSQKGLMTDEEIDAVIEYLKTL